MYTYWYDPEITIDLHVPEIAEARIVPKHKHQYQRGILSPRPTAATIASPTIAPNSSLSSSSRSHMARDTSSEREQDEMTALRKPAATFTPTLF